MRASRGFLLITWAGIRVLAGVVNQARHLQRFFPIRAPLFIGGGAEREVQAAGVLHVPTSTIVSHLRYVYRRGRMTHVALPFRGVVIRSNYKRQ